MTLKTGTDVTEFPPEPPLTLAEEEYSVFVQIEYHVVAVDGADAISQVTADLGQGRSYKRNLERQLNLSAKPVR